MLTLIALYILLVELQIYCGNQTTRLNPLVPSCIEMYTQESALYFNFGRIHLKSIMLPYILLWASDEGCIHLYVPVYMKYGPSYILLWASDEGCVHLYVPV